MAAQHWRSVRDAIVLAAGNGERFHGVPQQSKLLTAIAGTPLLTRTLASVRRAGVTNAHVVLGYDAMAVRALVESTAPKGLSLQFHMNGNWHLENGLSVLAARSCLHGRPFALVMGDHVFDWRALDRLLSAGRARGESVLAIDRRPIDAAVAAEATKVRLDRQRIVQIGKTLDPYDGVDTGLFVCDSSLFASIEASCADGDSTLSGGVGRHAARGLVRGVDIGPSRWCDIDTVDDVPLAEEVVAARAGS